MPKDKKEKKKTIEQLHKILDNDFNEDAKIEIKNQKDLKDLRERLKKIDNQNISYKKISYGVSESEKTLEPKVTVYPRGKQKVEFSKIKTKVEVSKTEITFQQEDLFEVEKSKSTKPEFLEVKPRLEEKVENFEEVEPQKDLQEWQPVEQSEETTQQSDYKTKIEDKSESVFCINCGCIIDKKAIFCHLCGGSQQDTHDKMWEEAEPVKKKSKQENTEIKVQKQTEEWEEAEIEPKDKIEEEKWEEVESVEIQPKQTKEELKDQKVTEEWEEAEIVEIQPKDKKKQEKIGEIKKENNNEIQLENQVWSEISTTKEKWIEKEGKIIEKVDTKKTDHENNFCPICGTKSEPDDKFCKKCGTQISNEKIDQKIKKEIETELEKDKNQLEKEIHKIFKDYKTIDNEIAILLYDNGYTTIESLKNTSYNDLKKIKGLKRKNAKSIIDEINKKIQDDVNIKPIDISETAEKELSKDEIEEEIVSDEWVINEEEELEEKSLEEVENKKQFFKDFKSVDEDTAKILYDNGIKSSEELMNSNEKDLKKIKDLKKKKLKQIKKEIEENSEWDTLEDITEISIKEEVEDKEESKNEIKNKKEIKINDEEKIKVFKDVNIIDNDTAILLFDSGYQSIDQIRNSSIRNIVNDTGLKKRKVKQIDKEIQKILKSYEKQEKNKLSDEDFSEYFIEEEIKEDAKEIDDKIKDFVENGDSRKNDFFIDNDEKVKTEKLKENYFKDIDIIDETIAELLVLRGYDSIEKLRNATISELIKIKGIRRKIAKKIKKQVNQIPKKEVKKQDSEWESFEEEPSDKKSKFYSYKGYDLYKKEIITKNGNKRTVHFFSKNKQKDAKKIKLPKGYIVKQNKKTKVPYLKKKK